VIGFEDKQPTVGKQGRGKAGNVIHKIDFS